MSPEEIQAARAEADRALQCGSYLRAVAVLKALSRADLVPDDLHDTHLRLAAAYRAMGLAEEAEREILAVAAHWNEEGRSTAAVGLLSSNNLLATPNAPDLPSEPEVAREAVEALVRDLLDSRRPARPAEDTPIEDLLPVPKLPSSRPRPGQPGVPLPAPQVDTSDSRGASRLHQAIDRLGALVERDPSDVQSKMRLAELLIEVGRQTDGILHLISAAKDHERAGKPHEALKVYKQVLRLAPERKDLHKRLGDIYSHLGLLAEAASEYRKADKPR